MVHNNACTICVIVIQSEVDETTPRTRATCADTLIKPTVLQCRLCGCEVVAAIDHPIRGMYSTCCCSSECGSRIAGQLATSAVLVLLLWGGIGSMEQKKVL